MSSYRNGVRIYTDEMIAQIRDLAEQKCSALTIARKMGNGITRNAIIGKCHRLGIQLQGRPLFGPEVIRVKREQKPPKPARVAEPLPETKRVYSTGHNTQGKKPHKAHVALPPMPEVQHSAPTVTGAPASIMGLGTTHCKWPIGHPDEARFYFCGNERSETRPYCPAHMAIAYQSNQKRAVKAERSYGLPASGMRHRGGELA